MSESYERTEFPTSYEQSEESEFSSVATEESVTNRTVLSDTDYNGVVINDIDGVTITSLVNQLIMNASKGIEIKRLSDSKLVFFLDANTGDVIFSGRLSGTTGDFNGKLTASSIFIEPSDSDRAEIKLQSGNSGSPIFNKLYITLAGDVVGGLNTLYIGNNYDSVNKTVTNLGKIVVSATNIDFIGTLSVTDLTIGGASMYNPVFTTLPLTGATGIAGMIPRYTKVGKLVTIEGEIANVAAGTTIANLPATHRPPSLRRFKTSHDSAVSNDGCSIVVNANGNIVVHATANATNAISLCGISFYVN